MTVIGAYLKRRSNLIFLADRDGMVPVSEVALCLNESMDNLRLHVRRCASRLDFEGELRLETAAALYDFFEAAIELAGRSLRRGGQCHPEGGRLRPLPDAPMRDGSHVAEGGVSGCIR